MTIENMKTDLQSIGVDCAGYNDAAILLMHQMQLIIQDGNAKSGYKALAAYVYKLALDSNTEWQEALRISRKDDTYNEEMKMNAFVQWADDFLDDNEGYD